MLLKKLHQPLYNGLQSLVCHEKQSGLQGTLHPIGDTFLMFKVPDKFQFRPANTSAPVGVLYYLNLGNAGGG